jgi:hypothetical protein
MFGIEVELQQVSNGLATGLATVRVSYSRLTRVRQRDTHTQSCGICKRKRRDCQLKRV